MNKLYVTPKAMSDYIKANLYITNPFPDMTSRNTPAPYVVFSEGKADTGSYAAYLAFTTPTQAANTHWTGDGGGRGIIGIKGLRDSYIRLAYYTIWNANEAPNYAPVSWVVEGSKSITTATWETIDTVTQTKSVGQNVKSQYDVPNWDTKPLYGQFRIRFLSTSPSLYTVLKELKFYGLMN